MTHGAAFHGAKAALICNRLVAVIRRDDSPEIPYPGMIDLPGGGREGVETPEACVRREIREELSLGLPAGRFHWTRPYPRNDGQGPGWFFVAHISAQEVAAMRLGDEGQAFWMMHLDAFLTARDAIPFLRDRLGDYLGTRGCGGV